MDRLECDRMFVAVMETGSFVSAADRLKTSAGQASKLVSRLETDLGVRLLNRTTRSVSPTEAGQAYYDRLRPLLDEHDALDLDIRNISQTPRGRLRVSVPQTFGVVGLAPLLSRFAADYPEIELDVNFSDRAVHLVEDGFDLAVRIGRPQISSLVMRKLFNVRLTVVAAPDYLSRNGTPARPEDLSAHNCILDTNFADPRKWPLKTGQGEGVRVAGRVRFSNAEACLKAAEAGLGLACVPNVIIGDAISRGRVLRLLEDFEPEPYDLYVLYPHSRQLSTKVRLLVDRLVDHYKGQPQ
ncbi:LysR family transcriptional regulator [Sulfitobacter sp. PS-8MA]|uniref:LysR family transcriptional regulator n=1 Tax=Sulfitobacter sp. PS-8MA TaxID=3237707 RepID=UPI0034C614CE